MDFGNEKFKLERPDFDHEGAIKPYIEDYFRSSNGTDRAIFFNSMATGIYGSHGLFQHANNYTGWLEKIARDRMTTDGGVPSETYFFIREETLRYGAKNILPKEEIVGMVTIRLKLDDTLWQHGGHIGYNIRPSMRGKGYAKIMLFLTLRVCQGHGLESVLLTCNKTNLASAATIRALDGGLLHEKHFSEQQYNLQYFTINVKNALANHEAEYNSVIIS